MVTVTVEASGGSSALSSQPQPKTTRRPGSTSRKLPAATCPGETVQRKSPPARRSTTADTVCQRRSRSGSVISANASSGDTGRVAVLVQVIRCSSSTARP